uniref:Proline-rich nuclear receptor coactivator 2 n=1 Tax=Ciona savignyi TaxID=51511 RepID=H2Y7Z1_CIOSA
MDENFPPAEMEKPRSTGPFNTSPPRGARPKQRVGRKTPSPNKEVRNNSPNSPLTPFWTNHQQLTCPVSTPRSPNSHALFNSGSYAGARFHSPPTADVLPKPPLHWVNPSTCAQQLQKQELTDMSQRLKGMLKVPS